jgi:hypothetical protein
MAMAGETNEDRPGGARGRDAGAWRARNRRTLLIGAAVGALLIVALQGLAAISRNTAPRQPNPVASVTESSKAIVRGARGSLFVLTGSDSTLPAGEQGAQLWRLSLTTGRIDRGPAVAVSTFSSQFAVTAPSTAAEALAGDNLMIGETLQPGTGPLLTAGPFFLSMVPVDEAGFEGSMIAPVAQATAFSVASDGTVAFVGGFAGRDGAAHLQVAGTWRPDRTEIAFQAAVPSDLELTGAYLIGHRVFVSATRQVGRCFGETCPKPPVAFLSEVRGGRLRTALSGWAVLAPSPDGASLLLRRNPGPPVFIEGGREVPPPPARAWTWRPGKAPQPFPAAIDIQRVVAWSADGSLLAVDGSVHGRDGFYVLDSSGAHQVKVPAGPGVETIVTGTGEVPTALSASWSNDDRSLFLASGLSLFSYDVGTEQLTEIELPGEAGRLPVTGVVWAPGG